MEESLPTHKVQVSFTNETWGVIKKLGNTMGKSDAELVRNIVLAWLCEKSMISTNAKNKMESS